MSCRRFIICFSCVWLLNLVTTVSGIFTENTTDEIGGISTITSITVACLSVLILVFVISLCGGCTPMEVGSENHAAAGGIKHGGSYGHYDSMSTDANTRVLTAGTTLPNDPYEHQDHGLPYDLHPTGSATAQTFTGYTPVHQPAGPRQGAVPSHGQSGSAGNQPSYQGAHRTAFDSEPPPPAYEEATRPTAPAQPYGW